MHADHAYAMYTEDAVLCLILCMLLANAIYTIYY